MPKARTEFQNALLEEVNRLKVEIKDLPILVGNYVAQTYYSWTSGVATPAPFVQKGVFATLGSYTPESARLALADHEKMLAERDLEASTTES